MNRLFARKILRQGPYQVEVLLKTSLERAQQVIPPELGSLDLSDKGVIFRRATRYLDWLVQILINLEFPILVIQPVELREMLREMAGKILEMIE